jgi:hypothetical protein
MSEPRAPRLSEDALRRVYTEGMRATDTHPDEATLGRLLGGELAPGVREAALEHVARCAECAALLQHGARCVECAEILEVKPPRPAATRGWALWGGLAAAAALVAGVAIFPSFGTVAPTPDPETLRAGPAVALAAIAPAGRIETPPAEFRWQGLPDAVAYRVVLLDERGEPLWTSAEVADLSCPWPSKLPLPPGSYSWQVIATLRGSGAERIASPLLTLDAPQGLAPVP